MTRFGRTAAWLMAAALAGAAPGVASAQQGPTGPNVSSVGTGAPGLSFIKTKMPLFAYAGPDARATVVDEIVGQTVLPTTGCAGGWCRVVVARAQPSYVRQDLVEPVTPQQ